MLCVPGFATIETERIEKSTMNFALLLLMPPVKRPISDRASVKESASSLLGTYFLFAFSIKAFGRAHRWNVEEGASPSVLMEVKD